MDIIEILLLILVGTISLFIIIGIVCDFKLWLRYIINGYNFAIKELKENKLLIYKQLKNTKTYRDRQYYFGYNLCLLLTNLKTKRT